jgi:hypothetical protein
MLRMLMVSLDVLIVMPSISKGTLRPVRNVSIVRSIRKARIVVFGGTG